MKSPSLCLLSCVVAAALVLGGCRKPQPSPDYAEAQQKFAAIYGQKLDEAYDDPRMEEILAQLRSVPEKSSDNEAAKELIKRITDGQAANARARSEREAAAAEALRVPAMPHTDWNTGPAKPAPPAQPAAVVDAGPPPAPAAPKEGMSTADFEKYFGDCFEGGPTIYLGGAGQGAAQARGLRDYNRCKDKLPGFSDKWVLVQGSSIVSILNKSEIRTETVRPDGGMLPDAGR